MELASADEDLDISILLDKLTNEDYAQIEVLSDQEPKGTLHLTTNFSEDDAGVNELNYYFAVATTKKCPQNCSELKIPVRTWAVFTIEGEWAEVNEAWQRIYSEWFPMSEYQHAEGPEIIASKDDKTEIWNPVQKN